VLLGIVDAKLILEALKTRWVGAVTTPFLNFHWTLRSLLLGGIIGGGISIAAIAWVSRKQLKRSAVSLLASKGDEDVGGNPNAKRFWNRWLSRSWIGLLAVGLVVMGYSTTLGGTQAAGGFVGGGMLLLLGSLAWVYRSLVRGGLMPSTSVNGGLEPSTSVNGLPQLAWTAAGRNPVRSTLAIGLMAIAAFLIVSMTAFQLAPSQTGTGGYEWIATTASPIYRSLSDDEYRDSILGSEADALESIRIEPIRRHAGQNASCNNLYRAAAPTVLGVRPSIAQPRRNADQSTAGFQWIGHAAMDGNTAAQGDSPWKRLETIATGTQADPIPVVIDQNTAMWSLGLYEGIGQEKSFRYNETDVYFRVVGLLGNSILQGRLIIGEANFRMLFPDISGDSFFLIDVDPRGDLSSADKRTLGESVSGILENRLSDVGMDVRDSDQVLTELLAVQNTYLRTFQSLGVLGLLLGTVGLAIAQVRSMVSRRGELALMRAIGYSRGRISRLVLGETMTLLLLGVGCGSLCALAALVPVWLQGGLPPSWLGPVVSLVAVCGFGIVAGGLAVAKVARMPILAGLRGDG
ncbi:MAG: ABC transporter permease, partial [Planctomycetota bacterium]